MAGKEVILTYDGLKDLEKELELLKSVKRMEIAERIKIAISFGDLTENSEYDDAKTEQAHVEGRIQQLEQMLKNARVIDEDEVNTESVGIGSKVRIQEVGSDEEEEYTMVGSTEANPMKQRISNESPVGMALVGRKVGDEVEASVPNGTVRYVIKGISK